MYTSESLRHLYRPSQGLTVKRNGHRWQHEYPRCISTPFAPGSSTCPARSVWSTGANRSPAPGWIPLWTTPTRRGVSYRSQNSWQLFSELHPLRHHRSAAFWASWPRPVLGTRLRASFVWDRRGTWSRRGDSAGPQRSSLISYRNTHTRKHIKIIIIIP